MGLVFKLIKLLVSGILSGFKSTLLALVFLLVLAVVFVAYRLLTYSQLDNAEHLVAKQNYLASLAAENKADSKRPNIIFILYDDMGYGDIGVGAPDKQLIRTPNIDRLAQQGVSLTQFYSPAPVCTPARAGYLTGRLPLRAGMPHVVFPTGSPVEIISNRVINPSVNNRFPSEEITLANVLAAAGYRTGMVGKWHLGDESPSLPNEMGFDEYYGALYSNDMEPFALYRNREIDKPAPVDQRYLSEQYSKAVLEFIEMSARKASDQPFFLYLAHNFPHDPLFVRESRLGQSNAGLFGDVLEELDDGVGEIISALEQAGQLDNTLIILSSDNGPWFLGNAGNQRGRKGNTFEGGMRVPFIAHWPAVIPGGRVESAMAMGIDLLPTVLDILQLPQPADREIDGRSILNVLVEGSDSPHEALYYYDGLKLFAVRDQRFKYRGPAGVFYSTDEAPMAASIPQKEWLFDMQAEARESYDTSARYPEDLQRLRELFTAKQREMKENPRGWR